MVTTINSARPQSPARSRAAAADGATFNYNSQDSTVFAPGTVVIPGVSGGSSPETKKVILNGTLAPTGTSQYVYNNDSADQVAAQAFATVAHTVDVFSKAMGQPVNWAFGGPQLGVNPDQGEDFNAFYSRGSGAVNFFHGTDPVTNKTVFSGNSGEVDSHETGHAILDSFRPAYFQTFTPDVRAFHEAFGDMMGMCMSFQDPRVIDNVAKATGGDMSQPNIIAATGEELGTAINDHLGVNKTGGAWVRNMLNDFKWEDPDTLPAKGDATHLGSEAHSFSRLWSGAFYDVANAINKENLAANPGDPQAALKATGDEMLKLLAEMVKGAPQADFTYRDMANAWVQSDRDNNGGQRADLIKKVMTDRGILGTNVAAPDDSFPGPDDGSTFEVGHSAPPHPSFTFTSGGMKSLAEVTHPINLTLGKSVPDPFQGAKVQTLVDNDGGLAKDSDTVSRIKKSINQLIAQDQILVTTPGQKLTTKDYFRKDGTPYVGVLVYNNDGSKSIERVQIAS